MSREARASVVPLLALLLSGLAAAQKDVTLETLARAMEGKLGIYARNLTTGEQIAINADKAYPSGALRTALEADSRPAGSSETRSESDSPRALAELMRHRHVACPKDLDHPVRRALICDLDRSLVGAGLSPVIEVGGSTNGLMRSPGIAGYVATKAGDLVFCVMASELDSSFTASEVFPEVVESLVRRLVPSFGEPPLDPKPAGLILASLHDRRADPKLFPKSPDAEVADLRRGSQRLTFGLGDAARVAVLGRPKDATRVTIQCWSPAQRAEARSSVILEASRIGDAVFDLPLDKAGCWRVRVAFGDVVVLDEKFFVTGK